MAEKGQGVQISHEWIYQHILADKQAGGDLYTQSRFTLMQPVDQRLADLVSQAMISLLSPFADLVHTITGDNGWADPTILSQEN